MKTGYQIVVCGGIVPDPLQSLEPVKGPNGFALKNEMMLPSVLDTWSAHALFEAAALAKKFQGSKVWLISIAPKMKLQQVMMTIAQKASFELIALDAQANGFSDSNVIAIKIAEAINGIPEIDKSRLMIFGGWESAARSSGVTMQIVGEILHINNQFQGVDELNVLEDGSIQVLERVDGGKQMISICKKLPAIFGWATGNLPEPPNNPQTGMANMRTIMPALQKAKPVALPANGLNIISATLPRQVRQTRIVKDMTPVQIADELVNWINS
jgi:electron transfer flavoprotein beta subunit